MVVGGGGGDSGTCVSACMSAYVCLHVWVCVVCVSSTACAKANIHKYSSMHLGNS